MTTRRTIILVLAMLFSVPIFSRTTYLEDPNPFTLGFYMLAKFEAGSVEAGQMFDSFWFTNREMRTPIISLYYKVQDKEGRIMYERSMESEIDP